MLKGIQRGFVINGESKDDFSALPVSSAGDVNGDGLDDLIIGIGIGVIMSVNIISDTINSFING
jgi:hypothetical protein